MRRLVAVPHSEIKANLDAEKRAKERKRTLGTIVLLLNSRGATTDHQCRRLWSYGRNKFRHLEGTLRRYRYFGDLDGKWIRI